MFRRLLVCCLGAGLSWGLAENAQAAEPKVWTRENVKALVELYRDFHRHPEISFHEKETAKRLATALRAAGVEVTEGVGGHGVVGLLKNGPGPVLMFRTDLDALPVAEKTELAYASQARTKSESGGEVGVMHACGHDIHITNLIGVAQYLAANKDHWSGTLMFLGQPAEERGAGAKAMLDDGLFTRFPRPDLALALHVDSHLATGKIGYRAGYAFANVDSVDITVRGRGGHGSAPQSTVDPIVQAAHLIIDLQTIVSREISPLDQAVVTVGSIHGGSKHNIIPDNCLLQLTVRSYTEAVREKILTSITRKARAAAASFQAPEPVISVSEGTPALSNDEKLVNRLLPIFQKSIGMNNVVPSEPTMGGEDFSRYGLAGVPIFMFRLGSVDAARLARYEKLGQVPSLHSPLYYPDAEPTLETGVTVSAEAILHLLPPAK